MHMLYKIVTGPMMWLSLALFIAGAAYRLWHIYRLVLRKERFILSYMSLRYSLRSLVHWLTPFSTVMMRRNPVMTMISFAFHISSLLVPIFLLSHVVLWEEAWGISWWSLPMPLADTMTLIVLAAIAYFFVRRMTRPEVRYVTTPSDYYFLVAVCLPFFSGFYCCRQWPGHEVMMLVHIVSGQSLLAILPFTRMSHMLSIWFTRSYMGSEFGAVRHARDY